MRNRLLSQSEIVETYLDIVLGHVDADHRTVAGIHLDQDSRPSSS